ncbi:MAG: hypothetical protein JKY93_06460 [Gammaproteobacteria bacterium]|nr:hypothetical protein [Gammaproteobacteria bacterium]
MKNKIFKTSNFGIFIAMIFLNTFVNLGHKTTIQNTVFKAYDDQTQIIFTALANTLM